jgi:hypothetical protein
VTRSLPLTRRTAPTPTARASRPPKTFLTSGRWHRPPCSQPAHTHKGPSSHSFKCIQTLKIRGRITYAEPLDPSPGGPVGVGEGHVRRRRTIVSRNVHEPSKEVSVPLCGDVDRPHHLASIRQSPTSRCPPNRELSRRRGSGTCVSLVATGP